jgi:hypothetical protein
MYINGKMRSVETIPRMGEEWIKENDREGESIEGVNSTMIYSKNFCKCHNVAPSLTII